MDLGKENALIQAAVWPQTAWLRSQPPASVHAPKTADSCLKASYILKRPHLLLVPSTVSLLSMTGLWMLREKQHGNCGNGNKLTLRMHKFKRPPFGWPLAFCFEMWNLAPIA